MLGWCVLHYMVEPYRVGGYFIFMLLRAQQYVILHCISFTPSGVIFTISAYKGKRNQLKEGVREAKHIYTTQRKLCKLFFLRFLISFCRSPIKLLSYFLKSDILHKVGNMFEYKWQIWNFFREGVKLILFSFLVYWFFIRLPFFPLRCYHFVWCFIEDACRVNEHLRLPE